VTKEHLPDLSGVAFEDLAKTAAELNFVTDQLVHTVSQVDAALKVLGLGIECWVQLGTTFSEDGRMSWADELGYGKVGGKWCIALRTTTLRDGNPDDHAEEWAFHDAPRNLRIEAVDAIPRLLVGLQVRAAAARDEVSAKLDHARQIVSGLQTKQSRKEGK